MGYVKDFFSNWNESDAPAAEKLRRAAKNRLRAARRGCCGNHGEPGC